MKLLTILLWLAAIAAGGLLIGQITAERSAAKAELAAEQARLTAQRQLAEKLARLVRSSDEVAIISSLPETPDVTHRFQDAAWIESIADLLEQAPCERSPYGEASLWISFPIVHFYQSGKPVIAFMTAGGILRVLGVDDLGDISVGAPVIATFNQAVADKMP